MTSPTIREAIVRKHHPSDVIYTNTHTHIHTNLRSVHEELKNV